MTPEHSITLLHVSDVQFGRNHRFGNLGAGDLTASVATLLRRLEDDLKMLAAEFGLRPQVVIVSGDLAESGLHSEFSDALQFLEGMASSLNLPRRNVIVVPGNHDVNRKLCAAYFSECAGAERQIMSPYARKWEPYIRMFDDFYAQEPDIAFPVEQPWTLWEIKELKLVVAGLNSTLCESHRRGDHYGCVGEDQLRWFADTLKWYVQRGWFRLGVVHHNPTRGPVADDENLRDAELLGDLLGGSLNLLLHGHTHDSGLTWLGHTPLLVLSTGSAALKPEARPNEVPNQYQLIRLHADGVERWTRCYDPARRRWIADTSCSPDGNRWQIQHHVAFTAVHDAFRDGDVPTGAAHAEPPGRPTRGGGSGGFAHQLLSRVLEVCQIRYTGDGTQIDAIDGDPEHPYLRVRRRAEGVTESFPIGVIDGDVSELQVHGFCEEIFSRYWALDPCLRCEIVYSGTRASDQLERFAAARNVLLHSFIEFQGIIDFRDYVSRQTARLSSDVIYPPQLYVPQELVDEIGNERRTSSDAIAELMGWLLEPHARFVLVLGDFGVGKTFLLRELARRMPDEIPHLVPVLVELRSLEKTRTFEQLIAQHLATAGERFIDLKAFSYMLRTGRIALLFDGFDELAHRVTYKRATEHFETLLQAAAGDAKVVVTSRTQHFQSREQVRSALLGRAQQLRGLSLCHVQPFDDVQIGAFLERRLGDARRARDRLKLIDEIKDLLGLSRNPRMLGFIAEIPEQQLRDTRARTGTITAAQLYRLLIDQWLDYEWEKTQPAAAPPTLSREGRWQAVTALALCLWTKVEPTIYLGELTDQVAAAMQRLSNEARDEAALDSDVMAHQVGSRTLLVRDDEGAFAFVHASVMEWLVAHAAADQLLSDGHPEVLALREMTTLMIDFFCDLAGGDRASRWARQVMLDAQNTPAATANALSVLDHLGEQVGEASLAGEHFSGRDFTRTGLAGARLAGADLTEARMADSNLTAADLTGATLVRADLTRAVLVQATLDGVDARAASLFGADLRKATLARANLRRAKLAGALVDGTAFATCDTFGAALPGMAPTLMLTGPSSPAAAVAMHLADSLVVTGHVDGSARLWDVASGGELRRVSGGSSGIQAIAFSPDGRTVATAAQDGGLRVWDIAGDCKLRRVTGYGSSVGAIAFLPDGRTLASAGRDGSVRLWDVSGGGELDRVVCLPGRDIVALAASPDGRIIATADARRIVRLWDVGTGHEVQKLVGHEFGIRVVTFSPDSRVVASAGEDRNVHLWDVARGRELQRLVGAAAAVVAVAFSSDGQTVASAADDGGVLLWDRASERELQRLVGSREGRVLGVAVSSDGQSVVCARDDASVWLWNRAGGTELNRPAEHVYAIWAVAFTVDGLTMASAGEDRIVRLWDVASGRELHRLSGHTGAIWTLACSPSSQVVASAGDDGTVLLWDIVDGGEARRLVGHRGGVRGVAFSPDGRTVVSGGGDGTVRLWDVEGNGALCFKGHEFGVRAIGFSPDGRCLASTGGDGRLRLWDVASQRELHDLTGHGRGVRAVVFSPDGQIVASTGDDGNVRLWDVATQCERHRLTGHGRAVRGLAFSPDGGTVVVADEDGTVRLWDVAGEHELHRLTGHEGGVRGVAVSPDGQTVVGAGTDGLLRLWRLASGELLATLAGLEEGWLAFTPNGCYKLDGRIGNACWYAIGLCRFAPSELDPFLAPGTLRRLEIDDPLLTQTVAPPTAVPAA